MQFLINSQSSYARLLRLVAYLKRFINNCKSKPEDRQLVGLSTRELEGALKSIVRSVQSESFSKEIKSLSSQQHIKSSLKFLTPFMDKEGILRVGGRLSNAKIPYEQQHPILIPKNHHFTNILVRYFHLVNLHSGPTLLMSILRERFWIISAPKVVKSIIHKCVTCFRYKLKPTTQAMGELPAPRVNPSRPFSQVGVDYAGPFTVSISPGRNPRHQKSYVAVFVCMATKAIHLERVGDLSTPSFIASLQRFTSRRGLPADLYCDQGKNFVGAHSEFLEFRKFIQSKAHNQKVFDYLAELGVKFHFNPPLSPHHGGLWEAAVKSMKHHFRRVVLDRILTIEEFSTLLCEIEACLNSRPITQMTSDPDDFESLTPGHFLIGSSLKSIPGPDLTDVKENRLTRWQLTQQLHQHFWKRWSAEYLQKLQSRPKWITSQPNIKPGVLVALLDPDSNLGPCQWKLGRVLKTYPGKDGKVRVCDINTPNGTVFRRPITKISVLPIYDN